MRRLNIVVRLAVCFLFVFLPLHSLDQWFYDQFFNLRGSLRRTSPLVFFTVNDAKLSQNTVLEKKMSPHHSSNHKLNKHTWFGDLYAPLIAHIEKDNPRLVLLSSYFDQVEGPTQLGPYKNLLFSAVL